LVVVIGLALAIAPGGSVTTVPPRPSLAEVKVVIMYWPSKVMLALCSPWSPGAARRTQAQNFLCLKFSKFGAQLQAQLIYC
jgi:hypothetical protein